MVSLGKLARHALNCLSFHLATKVWRTKACSFGFKEFTSFSEVVSSYTSCNFFLSSPFFVLITSIAKCFHFTSNPEVLFSLVRHNGKKSAPHKVQLPNKQSWACHFTPFRFGHKIISHMAIRLVKTTKLLIQLGL
jgi:hypothetical protein